MTLGEYILELKDLVLELMKRVEALEAQLAEMKQKRSRSAHA